MPAQESGWTPIYETKSSTDAELVRTTLEVAGYRVSMEGGGAIASLLPNIAAVSSILISVPSADADDARDFLKSKTSLYSSGSTSDQGTDQPAGGVAPADTETVENAAQEVLDLRHQHQVGACKYCGIPTLDVTEADLESHRIALLRAAGLGVNSATFSEFQAGERICSECSGHEVTCDLCGRTLDAFIDEGQYVRAKDDEAYVCIPCIDRLESQIEKERDW